MTPDRRTDLLPNAMLKALRSARHTWQLSARTGLGWTGAGGVWGGSDVSDAADPTPLWPHHATDNCTRYRLGLDDTPVTRRPLHRRTRTSANCAAAVHNKWRSVMRESLLRSRVGTVFNMHRWANGCVHKDRTIFGQPCALGQLYSTAH